MYESNTPYLSQRTRVLRAFALIDIFRLMTDDVPADAVYLYCRNTRAFPVSRLSDAILYDEFRDGRFKDEFYAIPKCLKQMTHEYIVNNWGKRFRSILELFGYYGSDGRRRESRTRVTAFPPEWKNAIAAAYLPMGVGTAETIDQLRHPITTLHSAIIGSLNTCESKKFFNERTWQPLEPAHYNKLNYISWTLYDLLRRHMAQGKLPDPAQMELMAKALEFLMLTLNTLSNESWVDIVYEYWAYRRMSRESTSWLIDKCNGGPGPDAPTEGRCCCSKDCDSWGMIDGAMYYLSHLSPAAALCIGNIYKTNWIGQKIYDDRVLIEIGNKLHPRPEPCVGVYFMYESDLQLSKMRFFEDKYCRKNNGEPCEDCCAEAPCCR